MAKAWAAMKAIFFLTSSNSASGCLNCTRFLACSQRPHGASLRRARCSWRRRWSGRSRARSGRLRSPLPSWPRMFSSGTTMFSKASRPVAVPRMPTLSIALLEHLETGHVGRHQEGGDLLLLAESPGTADPGRARHDGQHAGDAAVGDPALGAVEDVGLAVWRRRGGGLHVGGVGAGFGLGQGEGGRASRR